MQAVIAAGGSIETLSVPLLGTMRDRRIPLVWRP